MAKSSILQKLRAMLSKDIKTECEVVYILAECRKLLEETSNSQPHFALKLYCHWALHVDLAGRDTTLPFLKMVDKYVEKALADTEFGTQHRMFREFCSLDSFRELLKQFLQSRDLPTQVCDDDDRWNEFLAAYANVIADGSLTCNSQPEDLKLISGVTFTKGHLVKDAHVKDAHLAFDMVWDIHLLDGRTLTANAYGFGGRDGKPEMMLWGHRIH